jgi:DNA polymerase-3 subunit alpha
MIKEAHRRGIITGVGRGSVGGSLVACLLGITSIDPIKYDLLFSRFLVPERCGLNWVDEITFIGEDIEIEPGETFVEVETQQGCIRFYRWAKLKIKRDDNRIVVYADDLQENDEILFDNRDKLWTLKEITE